MRTDIIEDLRTYYANNRSKIHILLGSERIKKVCDAYFIKQLDYRNISRKFGMNSIEVNKLMITAAGLIIRNRYG